MSTIRELREMMGKATAAPWSVRVPKVAYDALVIDPDVVRYGCGDDGPYETVDHDDAVLIAAMRNHFAALLDVAEIAAEYLDMEMTVAPIGIRSTGQDVLSDALKRLEAGHG